MKKVISGIGIMLCSVIIFGIVYIPAAFHSINLDRWSTPPGRYWTALSETGGDGSFKFSILLFIIGLIILSIGTFEKKP